MNKLAQVNIRNEFFMNRVSGGLTDLEGVSRLVSVFIKGSFVLAGIIILYFFVMAGIGMIAGAGQDDPKKMEQAKATATTAVIGFVIVFTSYWIVKLIGNIIGMEDLI